ncbi:MAG TPA: DUF4870 domain-containing protein [Syntrophothermus lipocalidus]|nr:DUF4870 domain-containing protein [Syntrophothermus lipocalidus]
MFCGQCGKEVTPGARFCAECGAPLDQPSTTSYSSVSGENTSQREGPRHPVSAAPEPSNAGLSDEEAPTGPLGSEQETGTQPPVGGAGTDTGLPRNLAALLSYVLGWLTGLVFYFIEKDSFVRFHAMQSILVFGGITGIYVIVSILFPLGLWRIWGIVHVFTSLLSLLSVILWVLLMVKAYQGERYKLPYIGDLAEQYAEKR